MFIRSSFPLLILLVSMMLGILLGSSTGSAHVLHRDNSSSSGPLLTSSYMKQPSTSHSTHSLVTSIIQLINILQWEEVIVLGDRLYYVEAEALTFDFRLNSLHYFDDISNRTEITQLLHQLHTQSFPELHFLLLSNYSMSLRLLQMVEQIDRESTRTTDFRHYSSWLVACFDFYAPSKDIHPQIEQMENVALISSVENEQTVLSHLETVPGGRILSSWRSVHEIKMEDDIFPNKKYGLNNRKLLVSLVVEDPYIIQTKTGFEGHFIDILNSLAYSMNFSYEAVHSEEIKWGKLVDDRWDGAVGQLERREVDLVAAPLAIHEDREKVMDFLYPPILTQAHHIMYRLYSDKGTWQIYLKPFKPLVLVVLLVILVMFTMVVGTVFIFEGDIFGRNTPSPTLIWKHRLSILTDVLFYVIGIFLNRGVEINAILQSSRVLLFTWGVFSVIIAACYSANLVASFSVQKPDLPFTSLGELVRQNDYKFGYISGAITEHIFNHSTTGDMRLVWEGVQKFYKTDPDVLSDNYSVHVGKAMTEKYAFIWHHDEIQRLRREDCSIRYVGQNIIWHHNGIGVPTNYPLKRELEHTLSRIIDSGLLDIWWRRWGGTPEDQCAPDDTMKPLTLPNTLSAFYLLCVGLGAAFLALVMEVIKYKQSICRHKMYVLDTEDVRNV